LRRTASARHSRRWASASNALRACRRVAARCRPRPRHRGPGLRQGDTQMIEAIQIAVDATQGNPAAAPAAQPQTSMYEVGKFAEAYRGGGSGSGNVGATEAVAKPAEPSQGMRALMSTFENLNNGAEKIQSLSQAITNSNKDPTPGEMMALTMEAHKLLFKAELTSNVANRTSDG